MRNIFPRLVNSDNQPLGRYPLTVVPVSDASPANVSIVAGGAAYFRFSVPREQSGVDRLVGGRACRCRGLVQFTVVQNDRARRSGARSAMRVEAHAS